MADESGDRGSGGAGGFGDRDVDVASPGFGDLQGLLDREIDRVNDRVSRSNELADLEKDPLDIPGTSLLSRIGSFFKNTLAPTLISRVPGGPLAGIMAGALYDKHALGFTDQELNDKYGRAIVDAITGGAFSAAAAFGRGAQWVAKKAGATGGPQDTFGDQPSGRGSGPEVDTTPESFDRAQFARNPNLKFSDGSQLLRDARMGRA